MARATTWWRVVSAAAASAVLAWGAAGGAWAAVGAPDPGASAPGAQKPVEHVVRLDMPGSTPPASAAPSPTPPAPTTAPPAPGTVLSAGVSDPAVAQLQTLLRTNSARDYVVALQGQNTATFNGITSAGLLAWERAQGAVAEVVADATITVGGPEWTLLVRQQKGYVPPAPQPVVPAICTSSPAIVCASITERTLRYYVKGSLDMSVEVRYGRPGYETPRGTWTLTAKDPNAWSHEFDAWMPWSLQYDLARGIYIHYSYAWAAAGDGPYAGSHGCINIKDWDAAKRLYERVPFGALVHVY